MMAYGNGSCVRGAHGVRGFTLIELLVVLLIMGVLAGLVSAVARPDDRGLLRIEAQRMSRLLDLAAAESRLTGKSLAWTADGAQFRFWRFDGNTGWSEIRDNELLRARTLPDGMTISGLRIENRPPQAILRLEFNPYGPPQAFSMDISLGAEKYLVAGSPVGEIKAAHRVEAGNGDAALP